jgi:predicted component of type VI protein secretion system
MEIGLLQSLNKKKYQDIRLTDQKLTFGRKPSCEITLNDIRCSGIHCSVTPIYKDDWEFIIEDLSSNGTYLNNELVR